MSQALDRYRKLMLELGTRRNNEHIGSGLGGNPELFLTLLALTPQFGSLHPQMFVVDNDNLFINTHEFTTAKFKDIRKSLDAAISKEVIYKWVHPELSKFIEFGPKPTSDRTEVVRSPKQEVLLSGFELASEMLTLIEKEIPEGKFKPFDQLSPELQAMHNKLAAHDQWVVLVSVRVVWQIDRMVRYNLDETFDVLLNKINLAVDSIA